MHHNPQLDWLTAAADRYLLFPSSPLRLDDCVTLSYSSGPTFTSIYPDLDDWSPEQPTLSTSSSSPSGISDLSMVGVSSSESERNLLAEVTDVQSRNETVDHPYRTINEDTRHHHHQSERRVFDEHEETIIHGEGCARCNMTEEALRERKIEKRREQNRSSQRKYRARKNAAIQEFSGRVAELESYITLLEKQVDHLKEYGPRLEQRVRRLNQDLAAKISDLRKSNMGESEMVSPARRASIAKEADGSGTWSPLMMSDVGGLHLALFDWELQPPCSRDFLTVI